MFAPFGVSAAASRGRRGRLAHPPDPAADSGGHGHDVHAMTLAAESSITVLPCLLHPQGRGRLRLRSADPTDPVVIDHRAARRPGRRGCDGRGVCAVRAVFETPSFKEVATGELTPATPSGARRLGAVHSLVRVPRRARDRDVPHGRRRRAGRRPGVARPRRRWAAGRRRIGDAHAAQRQHQCTHDHDRRARLGPDQSVGLRRGRPRLREPEQLAGVVAHDLADLVGRDVGEDLLGVGPAVRPQRVGVREVRLP